MLIAIAQHVTALAALAARRQVGILNIGRVLVAAGYRRHHQRDEIRASESSSCGRCRNR